GEVGVEHIDRVRARVGNLHQVEQRHDRFSILCAQVERIEVEAQTCEQRQTKNGDGQRRSDDPFAPFLQKTIQTRQRGKANRFLLWGRFEHGEQRRKQG